MNFFIKKTGIFLAGILLVIFLVYACDTPLEFPSSITFKTDDFKIDAPVRIGSFNLATIISRAVKEAFPENFEVYDMTAYPDYHVFLIAYEMVLMESFNPDDYLGDIQTQMGKMDEFKSDTIPPVAASISIPSLNMTSPVLGTGIYYSLNMNEFFDNMRDELNEHSTPPTNAALSYTQGGPITPPTTTSFMIDGQYGDNFTSINVDECEIELHISLQNADNNLTVNLNNITMIGAVITPFTVTLNSGNNYQTTATVTINSQTIYSSTPPQFQMGSITSTYDGESTPPVSYTLIMKPHIESITLNSAVDLKIGTGRAALPNDIIDSIKMDPFPAADMINAQIEIGSFWMDTTGDTTGLIIEHDIYMTQASPDSLPYIDPSECLAGKIEENLAGRWISGKPLGVASSSSIIITADNVNGSTFNLFTVPFSSDKLLLIRMNMGMTIEKLARVRWKMRDVNGDPVLPPITIDPINIGGEGGNDPVIKSINFEKIQFNVDFSPGLPQELNGKIALKINCPEFGFVDNPYNPRILRDDQDYYEFISTPKKYDVIGNPSVNIDVKLLPVIDGNVQAETFPYMEFVDIVMPVGNQNKELQISAEVSIEDPEWSSAEIDMQAALKNSNRADPEGTFPENDGDAVDMSAVGKYMRGITFGGDIEAKVFLSGPRKLIETIKPGITLYAGWEDKEAELLVKKEFKIGDTLPKLPGKNIRGEFLYPDRGLPEPDKGMIFANSFNKIFSSFPSDLRFNYEIILPDKDKPLTVYPDTFDDDNIKEGKEGEVKALLLIMLPMEFKAAPGAYIALADVFAEDEDLFGRKKPEDASLFTGVNINKLSMNLDFGYPFLGGSRLHFDREDILFGKNGLSLGGGNSLKVTFTSEQQKIINKNLIYPDIKFVFPEAKTLRIGRDSLPIRIVIEASGSYTLDLDDIGLGN